MSHVSELPGFYTAIPGRVFHELNIKTIGSIDTVPVMLVKHAYEPTTDTVLQYIVSYAHEIERRRNEAEPGKMYELPGELPSAMMFLGSLPKLNLAHLSTGFQPALDFIRRTLPDSILEQDGSNSIAVLDYGLIPEEALRKDQPQSGAEYDSLLSYFSNREELGRRWRAQFALQNGRPLSRKALDVMIDQNADSQGFSTQGPDAYPEKYGLTVRIVYDYLLEHGAGWMKDKTDELLNNVVQRSLLLLTQNIQLRSMHIVMNGDDEEPDFMSEHPVVKGGNSLN